MKIAHIAALIVVTMLMSMSCGQNSQPEPMSLVEMEREFGAVVARIGMPAGFSQFAADSGVVFVPKVANVKQFYKDQPADTSLLSWQPIYAEMASSGDLGWTTGPWQYRPDSTAKAASNFGHYITIWKMQPEGSWKFVADIGNYHGAPKSSPDSLRTKMLSPGEKLTTITNEQALASLRATERGFSSVSVSGGAKHAYAELAADDLRYCRNGRTPVQGLPLILEDLGGIEGALSWQPNHVEVSDAGDLGFSYGVSKLVESDTTSNFSFLHVWRKDDKGLWQLALDIHVETR